MNNSVHKDSRLLEALDHIDLRFIDETRAYYKHIPSVRALADEEKTKKSVIKSLKYVAALAACLLLLGAVMPLVQYLSGNLGSFLPSGTLEETSEMVTDELSTSDDEYLKGDYLETIKGLEPLTRSLLDKINALRLAQKAPEISIDDLNTRQRGLYYYGTFEGYPIFWSVAPYDTSYAIGIAGYDFYQPDCGFYLEAFINDKFIPLSEAYANNYFNQEQIKTVYLRFMEFNSYMDGNEFDISNCKIAITQNDLNEINSACEKKFGEGTIYAEKLTDTELHKDRYCYGKFNNAIVFRMVTDDDNYTQYINYIEVVGQIIAIQHPANGIWVMYNGAIYSLQEAYERGFLSKSDIEVIAYRNEYSYY